MTGTRGDKTVTRSLSLGGLYGGTATGMVDVKDGKILRVRPFRFDWKYDRSEVRTWKMEKNGKTLEPQMEVGHRPVLAGVQKAHLFAQPHQVPDDSSGLGSKRRTQSAEPRQEQVPPRLLG